MAAYFQMGHDTENLVGEEDLDEYQGIILSPVNREPSELSAHINSFREKGDYDIIIDSQLYFPRSEREKLIKQPYFPSDLDSADLSSHTWWDNIVDLLAEFAIHLGVNAVASPVIYPNTWSDDYFEICSYTSKKLVSKLDRSGIRTLTTVMVNLNQLDSENTVLRIASILSEADSAGYYMVIVSDVDPRRELINSNELVYAMMLIRELKSSGQHVLVSHCSSDMILYKIAGASHCATGKFFNLRRFTKSRWDEPSDSGGGQLPYWFEHSLWGFLRGADIHRLKDEGYDQLIASQYSNNHWANTILNQFDIDPEKAWLALAWRQYLSWFGKAEVALSDKNNDVLAKEWLKSAEENWLNLEDKDILLEEPRNNGQWVRPWRQAILKYLKT